MEFSMLRFDFDGGAELVVVRALENIAILVMDLNRPGVKA
jgi:hypothetical protein